VRGDVSITLTAYPGDSGNMHEGGTQNVYVQPPEPYVYRNIVGDFRGWFVRADLRLERVSGKVDVRNEFGDTRWAPGMVLSRQAHRVISESGLIEIQL